MLSPATVTVSSYNQTTALTSMENLGDISEPQILSYEQKDQ